MFGFYLIAEDPLGYKAGVMTAAFRFFVVGLLASLLWVVAGCGGSTGTPPKSLSLNPATVTIPVGSSQQFTAYLTGGSFDAILWSVVEGAAGGTISESGLYTAPATPGTYHVQASVSTNPSIQATATVTVSPGVGVSITTTAPRMIPLSKLNLQASVTGTSNTTVNWTVTQGDSGGTVTPAGVYTAPATPGTYEVVARSVADPSKRATLSIVVSATASVRLSIEGKGDVTLQLDPVEAPITSANFVTLANSGFYDGIVFHRYVAGFVIQGGDPLTKTLPINDPSIGTGGPGYTIAFESNNLKHVKYALAMASTGTKVGGGSQFYICLDDQPTLDGNYAVFGMTIGGTAIVDSLRVGDKILSAVVIP